MKTTTIKTLNNREDVATALAGLRAIYKNGPSDKDPIGGFSKTPMNKAEKIASNQP